MRNTEVLLEAWLLIEAQVQVTFFKILKIPVKASLAPLLSVKIRFLSGCQTKMAYKWATELTCRAAAGPVKTVIPSFIPWYGGDPYQLAPEYPMKPWVIMGKTYSQVIEAVCDRLYDSLMSLS